MVRTANKISSEDTQVEDSQVEDSLVSVDDTQVETGAQAAQTSQNTEGAAQAEEAAQGIEAATLAQPAGTAQASEAQMQTDLLRQIFLQEQQQTVWLKTLARDSHNAKLNTKLMAAQLEEVLKMLNMLKTDKAEEAETDEPDEPEKAAETHQAEEAAAEVASSASVEIGSQAGSDAGPIYCNACQMYLNGKEQMHDHLLGKKHKKAAKRVRRGC